MIYEMPIVTSQMTGNATPRVNELLLDLLWFESSLMECEIIPLRGFWLLLATLVLEKLVVHLLTSMSVAQITERIAAMEEPTESHRSNQQHIALLFSPATRYVFFSEYMYSGLPRRMWERGFLWAGVFEQV
jgi:hypothetical protein